MGNPPPPQILVDQLTLIQSGAVYVHTANMYSGITVEVQLKNCTFEKLQFFTVDHSSLYFLLVKNCNFSII
jgi:hypothetical protein